MALLAEYIQRAHARYPGNFPPANPFPQVNSHAPTLLKGQTNRIILYRGCFSPPHIGHLRQLKHAFEHGGKDLNMIAAIIKSHDGFRRPATAKCTGKVISFSAEESIALWKNDARLLEWAWAYEGSMDELRKLLFCLVETAKEDGFLLEFVALFGSDYLSVLKKPNERYSKKLVELIGSDGVERDVVFGGCKVTMICDAGRKPVISIGSLERFWERFTECEGLRTLVLDRDVLEGGEKAKADIVMAVLKEKDVEEYQRLVEKAGSEEAAIAEKVNHSVTEAMNDNQRIFVCHAKYDKELLIRLVRLDRSAPGFKEVEASATILRDAIETEVGEGLREKVKAMALSPELLLKMIGGEIEVGDGDDGGKAVDHGCHETSTGSPVKEEE